MLAARSENAVGHSDQASTLCQLLFPEAFRSGGYMPREGLVVPSELMVLQNVHTADVPNLKAFANVAFGVQRDPELSQGLTKGRRCFIY